MNKVDSESVKRALNSCKKDFEFGFYAPLSKRYPIYSDEAIPTSTQVHINSVGTCACTDGSHVYFDTENCAKLINSGREVLDSKGQYYYSGVSGDVYTIIAHEYTHILMEHVKRGYKFLKKYGKKNFRTFQLACDIEANRGYLVSRDSSMYQSGVTEDSFPETKGVEGLMNIYEVLLKHHKDDIDEEYDNLSDDEEENEEENKSESAGKGEENNENEGGEGNEESSSESQKNERPSKPSTLSDEQKQAIKNAIEKMQAMEEEIEEYAEEEENGSGIGSEEDEEDIEDAYGEQSPYEVLQAKYNDDMRKQTKVVMKNLRNIISGGNQVREKVKTYSRPARRDGEDGLMRKGTKYAKVKAPKILIAMDSSGSMSSTTMQKVVDSIGTIIDELGRDKKGSYICEHDEYVRNLSPLNEWRKVVANYYASGGNDFNAVLRTAIQNNVEVVLNVGDGCGYVSNGNLIQQAKDKHIVWYDVIISDRVNEAYLRGGFYDRLPDDDPLHFERNALKIVL